MASFGPVFIVAGFPVTYFVISLYETSVSTKKTRGIYKKKLTYGPNDSSGVVWACFHTHPMSEPDLVVAASPVAYFVIRIHETLVSIK